MITDSYIDITELDDIFGEMDKEETRETIESLQGDFALKLQELTQCLDQKDLDTFKLKAHSLKSNCCYLGAMQLNKISLQLELTNSFNDLNFSEHWHLFNDIFTATMTEIDNTIQTLQK